MKFIVSGGGTGGHVYPALAIIRGLEEKFPGSEFLYIGSRQGMEKEIVSRQQIPFQSIEIKQGLNRTRLIRSLCSACRSVPESFLQAIRLIRDFQPDAVIGTGGYVSFPVVAAGQWLKYPTFLHEQNAWPGLTNRMLAKKATGVMLTFPEAREHLKARRMTVTGLPVRPGIAQAKKDSSCAFLKLQEDLFTLLIFGGSLGAASINAATEAMLEKLTEESMQILWVTGSRHYQGIRVSIETKGLLNPEKPLKIHLYPYLYEMEQAMAAADLAVCRCGAATISELQMAGLAAILIPYPHAAENHQEKNALSLVKQGAGILIRDTELTGDILREQVENIRSNPEKQQHMKTQMKSLAQPDSLEKITAEIERGILWHQASKHRIIS